MRCCFPIVRNRGIYNIALIICISNVLIRFGCFSCLKGLFAEFFWFCSSPGAICTYANVYFACYCSNWNFVVVWIGFPKNPTSDWKYASVSAGHIVIPLLQCIKEKAIKAVILPPLSAPIVGMDFSMRDFVMLTEMRWSGYDWIWTPSNNLKSVFRFCCLSSVQTGKNERNQIWQNSGKNWHTLKHFSQLLHCPKSKCSRGS